MPLSARRRVVLAKIETTYGTDATPAAGTDAVLCASVNPTPVEIDYAGRAIVRPYFGNFEDLLARSRVKIDIELEAAGFGSAGPATPTPGYAALLRMCGLSQTVNTGTSVVYAPISSAFESGTIYFYQDGTFHKLTGCRGNAELVMDLNQRPMWKFSIVGLYNAPTDVALPSPTVSAFQRPTVVNRANTSVFTLHGFAARMKSLSLNLNNNVVHRNLVGQTTDEILITDRAPTGKVEIEATTVAAKDWWAAIQAITLSALSVTHGPATNQIQPAAPNVQLKNPVFNEDDNYVHLAMDLQFMPSAAGNDELTFTIK